MVSTAMQGGCTCENCCLLRIGTGNVELAALFAPRPLGMTTANDWTKEMMTKGYPELQRLYDLYGVRDDVSCRPLPQFPHNYNAVTRETMYAWFNKHLNLGLPEPIVEEDFAPLTPEEYTVWDADHPRPEGGDDYERALVKALADASDKQMAALTPRDAQGLAKFREVVGGAFRTIIGRGVPDANDIQRTKVDKEPHQGFIYFEDILRLQTRGEELPVVSLFPTAAKWNGDVVIWADGAGKRGMFGADGQPRPEVLRLVYAGSAVVSADLFQQGEFLPPGETLTEQRVVGNPREFAGYTFCYNDTLFAQRVHDLLTLLAWVRNDDHAPKRVCLIGVNGAGPVAAAARAIGGNQIDRAAIDTHGFRYADLTSYRDPDFLSGAVKYGDLPPLLALAAPQPLWIGGEERGVPEIVRQAYTAAGDAGAVESNPLQGALEPAVEWLLRR
jgi:hypothetical protein